MVLAAGTGDGLGLQRHHLEVVGEAPARLDRVEPLHQFGILGGDAGGILALVPVVISAGGGAELAVLVLERGIVVAEGDQRRRADRDRVRTERQGLGDVGSVADAAGDDQLHLAMHVEILQRLHGGADTGESGLSHILDEDFLGGGGTALHAVEHHHVGTGLHRQGHVVIGTGAANLHIDRLFPIGDFAQFEDLDLEIVRPGPVGVAAGRALVDALGQRAHLGDAIGDLLAQQHAAAAGLGALADYHLDGICLAQVVRIHAVARGQILIDQRPGLAALFRRHAAVTGGGRGAGQRGAASEGFLGTARQRAEAHAGDGDRDLQFDRLLGEARAEHDIGGAALAIAFERIARDRGAEEEQVVEMRDLALGAAAADVIDAGGGGAADLGQGVIVEGRGLARNGRRIVIAHEVNPGIAGL